MCVNVGGVSLCPPCFSFCRVSGFCTLLLLQTLFPAFLCFSKTIRINIIDDEEYEKNKNFFLEIGEPRLLEMSERKGGGVSPSCTLTPSISLITFDLSQPC